MKKSTKILIIGIAGASLASIALATYSTSTRKIDGGSGTVSNIAYARASGVNRYAYLKFDGTTYSVHVAGTGITGTELCSSGLIQVTRPAISHDGNVVTFWATTTTGPRTVIPRSQPYAYVVGSSGPVTPPTPVPLTPIAGGVYGSNTWPPQATDLDQNGDFKMIFTFGTNVATATYPNCSMAPNDTFWKQGQLVEWVNGASTSNFVSTTDFSYNQCKWLVTSNSGLEAPAGITSYTISSDGSELTWAAKAVNQLSGVSQNNKQIIMQTSSGRELISAVHSSGGEGDGDSDQHSMTADGDSIAFESLATNLTSYSSDANGVFDIFVHRRSTSETAAAYPLANNNDTSNPANNGESRNPVISGDAMFVAFDSRSVGILGTATIVNQGYRYCFLSNFNSSSYGAPGTVELTSYLYNDNTDWRKGQYPSIGYSSSFYGFDSVEGDIATPVQSPNTNDIYELTSYTP